jgi:hypothetical protein
MNPMRKLSKIILYGNIVLRIYFKNNKFCDFQMNFVQASIMYLFMNHNESLTFNQIQNKLELNEQILKKSLHSLTCFEDTKLLISRVR